jgi:type I restriction enzyme S subunit
VPEHWEVKRLKRACHVFPSNVDKKSHEGETPVLLCNYTDVYYNEVIEAGMDFMAATASPDQIAKFTLRAGDTVITKDSETADDIAIAAHVPRDLPGVVCGYHLSIVRPMKGTNGAFVKRLFDSVYAKSCFEVRANGLTRVGLGQYELDNVELPFPPTVEQTAIAAVLDHETGKIDALVNEQKRLIELLKEKRQAVISHAVTKGLDSNAPMKHSGVEWLGEVPQHWDVKCVKHVSPQITVGIVVEPSKYYCDEDDVPALRSLNVRPGKISLENIVYISTCSNELLSKSKLHVGDIVAVRTGQPGTAAVVPQELDGCNCIDLIIIRTSQLNGCEQFLCWYLAADAAVQQMRRRLSRSAIHFRLHFNIGTAFQTIHIGELATNVPSRMQIADLLSIRDEEEIDALSCEVSEAAVTLSCKNAAAP